MNLLNEQIRTLQMNIVHYEKMAMLARTSSEKHEYKGKAEKSRDELNYILKGVDLDAR